MRTPSPRRISTLAAGLALLLGLPACEQKAPTTAKAPAVADAADWCTGHALPESMCSKCNPGIVEGLVKAGDWCGEHGFPESACPQCNPMTPPTGKAPAAAGARVGDPADWCRGHGLPESMCTKCNPELLDKFKGSGDWCPGHGFPESACPKCNPMTPPAGRGAQSDVPTIPVKLATPAIERAAGIETVPAVAGGLGLSVETTAHIDFDSDRVADVRSPVVGVVVEVSVTLGQRVEAGDPLFTLESVRVGEVQARRRAVRARIDTARAELERQEALGATAIASRRQVEVARQDLEVARSELRAIEASLRLSGAAKRKRDGRVVVRAPIAGTVIRRPANVGGFAAGSDSLATIADTSRMWALLDVPEWEAAHVRVGQPVSVRADGVVGQTFDGPVSWVSSEVDTRTRTVAARVELDNAGGTLRAGQFARASVQIEAPRGAAIVPLEALQRLGEEAAVFVRVGPGRFEARMVEAGRSDGRRVQIAGGVKEGDAIVTTGAFLLRTELSPESIGAGCCESEAPGS